MTELSDAVEQLSQSLPNLLEAAVREADELRAAGGDSSVQESITDLHSRLVTLRRAQDRLEELAAQSGRIRSRARNTLQQAQDAYDDKVAGAIAGAKIEEYSTAKERNANYDLAALQERLVLRRAKRLLAIVEDAHEFIVLRHRGVDGARRDIDLRFRMMSFEMRMEAS